MTRGTSILTVVTGGDPGPTAVRMGRVGEPETAEAIAWLRGDGCPYSTGTTVRAAGGR